MIEAIEYEGYEVDSADKHNPSQWITAYKDGNEYEIEVNKYFDGTYEIVKADLVGSIESNSRFTKIVSSEDVDFEDDGWSYSVRRILSPVFARTEDLMYEIRNTVKGAMTGCYTIEELSDFIRSIAEDYEDAASEIKSL